MADVGDSRGGWRKSSRSESGACVEVRIGLDEVQVRHSADREGRAITFSYQNGRRSLRAPYSANSISPEMGRQPAEIIALAAQRPDIVAPDARSMQ